MLPHNSNCRAESCCLHYVSCFNKSIYAKATSLSRCRACESFPLKNNLSYRELKLLNNCTQKTYYRVDGYTFQHYPSLKTRNFCMLKLVVASFCKVLAYCATPHEARENNKGEIYFCFYNCNLLEFCLRNSFSTA